MKTLIAPLHTNRRQQTTAGQKLVPAVVASLHEILAVLGAVTAATTVVMLSIWLAGMEINNILGAAIWGVGFLFLGLALDNREPTALLQLATGVTLLIMAWLQNTVSPDFIIVSGVLVAIWVATTVFKRASV